MQWVEQGAVQQGGRCLVGNTCCFSQTDASRAELCPVVVQTLDLNLELEQLVTFVLRSSFN